MLKYNLSSFLFVLWISVQSFAATTRLVTRDYSGQYCVLMDFTELASQKNVERMEHVTLTADTINPNQYIATIGFFSGAGMAIFDNDVMSLQFNLGGGVVLSATTSFSQSGNRFAGTYEVSVGSSLVEEGGISATKDACWSPLPPPVAPTLRLPVPTSTAFDGITQGSPYKMISGELHDGIDLGIDRPTTGIRLFPFLAPMAGVITEIQYYLLDLMNPIEGLGLRVTIKHNKQWSTIIQFEIGNQDPVAFDQLKKHLAVKIGQSVEEGQLVGWLVAMPDTNPLVRPAHVHWALKRNGGDQFCCPLRFLNTTDQALLTNKFSTLGLGEVCQYPGEPPECFSAR